MTQEELILYISVLTLIAAVIGAVYAVRAFRLKAGTNLKGSFGILQSIETEDMYVHEVVLENMKDRAVAIFAVYLQMDNGYYLQIEDFGYDPLVLEPFGVFKKKYEPIDHYVNGMVRIDLDELLGNHKVRKRLVVSTSNGKYKIRNDIMPWDPVRVYFRNYATAIARPKRSLYEEKAIGSRAKYVVILKHAGRAEEIVPVFEGDYRIRKFRGFMLTKSSLASRDALEEYLFDQAAAGKMSCVDIEVLDHDDWRSTVYSRSLSHTVKATPRSWLAYAVGGWFETRWYDFQNWRSNRAKGIPNPRPNWFRRSIYVIINAVAKPVEDLSLRFRSPKS